MKMEERKSEKGAKMENTMEQGAKSENVKGAGSKGPPNIIPVTCTKFPSNKGPTILICIHFQTFHLCLFSVVDFHV